MNKIIILVIIAVIVLGGGWWLMKDNSSSTTSGQNNINQEENNQPTTQSSVADLLQSGKNVTCTYSHVDEDGEQTGQVYLADGKMRGEFTMIADGRTISGHMIQDGEWSYTWGGPMNEKQGIKMNISSVDQSAPESSSQNNDGFDPEADYNYDCDSWSPDQDMFIPPADITFQDLSAQLQQVQQMQAPVTSGQTDNSQCALCEQAPEGEARQQCRQAFNCQ